MLFYLKKQRNYQSGLKAVYLRITVDRRRSEVTTGRECDPEKWNNNSGRAKGTKEETKSFNAFLDNLQAKVYEAHRYLSENEKEITAESLKNRFLGRQENVHNLFEIFEDHNKKIEALKGKEFSVGTIEKYKTALRHTREFLMSRYGFSDIAINKIDHSFISEYDFYLRSVRHCSNNTSVKYLSNFGKIVRIGLSNGWISADPFANFKGKIKTIDRGFLTDEELKKMAEKNFEIDRLEKVRDVFLFCCYTGLAYVDVKKLKNSEISIGLDSEQWILIKRQKTDTRSSIPLLPTALKLIEKYADHPDCVNKGTPLPVPSNQKMNGYLKEIAAVCGINKPLTSHIARHTFATTITLGNGVPIETVSKMLGHSSIKQTQHYAKILDLKVSADMLLLKQKLSLKQNKNYDIR